MLKFGNVSQVRDEDSGMQENRNADKSANAFKEHQLVWSSTLAIEVLTAAKISKADDCLQTGDYFNLNLGLPCMILLGHHLGL